MEFKVILAKEAEQNYFQICNYILDKFSEKEVAEFDKKLTQKLLLLSVSPFIFPIVAEKQSIRKCLISNLTVVYYTIEKDKVYVLHLFDGRQNPEKIQHFFE
jgi:plasmid stabilization system protein ParE